MRRFFLALLTLAITAAIAHATPLHDAAREGDIDRVLMLVGSDADPNATIDSEEARGLTALHAAVGGGLTDVVAVLLEAGADPNATIDSKEARGFTSLHGAASIGHTEIVTTLLEAGADRHTRDDRSRTALNIAVTQGHTGTIRALLEGTDDESTITFEIKHPAVSVSIKGVKRSDLYDEETKVMIQRAAELAYWGARQLASQKRR